MSAQRKRTLGTLLLVLATTLVVVGTAAGSFFLLKARRAKDGLTAGVTTIASYAVPKRGPLAGQQRVVMILLNDLPLELWRDVVQYQGLYLLQADLAQASGVFDRLRSR